MGAVTNGSLVLCCTWARRGMTTGPPRWIMPQTGGLSFANGPRPPCPWRRRRRPGRPGLFTTSGLPGWPAITEASSHSPSWDSVTVGFLYDPITPRGRPLLDSTALDGSCVRTLLLREMQSHAIPTSHPSFERLRMSRKHGVHQIIKALVAGETLRALACRFRVLKASLDERCGLTPGTRNAVCPAPLADALRTRHSIAQMLASALHPWTPGRGEDMGGHPYTTSSKSTTRESNMSPA